MYTKGELFFFSLVVAVLFFITGLGAGARLLSSDAQNKDMVQCEEDEYWYPTEDYIGKSKGGNDPSDLRCVHVDVIKGE